MPRSNVHPAKATDTRTEAKLDPAQPRPADTPRPTGHKAPEPNPSPRFPGDDERDQGLVGSADPAAPARTVNPEAQRKGQEKIRRETAT